MTREEAIQWLKVINTKEFGWDEFALQESQREIRERCEQGVREAIDMAIEALQREDEFLKSLESNEPLYDMVDVVRCKDCRYYECSGLPCPLDVCESLGDNGFCSCGERKGGEDE